MSTAASDLPGVSGESRDIPLRFVTAASLFDVIDFSSLSSFIEPE